MIGIIGAMAVEIDEIKARVEESTTQNIGGCTFVCGRLNGQDVAVAQCGIGKVNAAVCAQTLILTYKPELVINVGVGGSLTAGLKYGDIAIAEKLVQHDSDTSALGDPVGLVSTVNKIYFECDEQIAALIEKIVEGMEGVHGMRGVIATGDQFIGSAAAKAKIVEHFNAISCEMEGGAIAQACYINGVKCAVIRSISDNADDDSNSDYGQFTRLAAAHSMQVVCELLKALS